MAVYRLHRKEWERSAPRLRVSSVSATGKRRADEDEDEDEDEDAPSIPRDGRIKDTKTKSAFPGGGRKGVSSGLSTVVRRSDGVSASGGDKRGKGKGGGGGGEWWKVLTGGGAKGSMRV
jgi:RNA exonuclease 4